MLASARGKLEELHAKDRLGGGQSFRLQEKGPFALRTQTKVPGKKAIVTIAIVFIAVLSLLAASTSWTWTRLLRWATILYAWELVSLSIINCSGGNYSTKVISFCTRERFASERV